MRRREPAEKLETPVYAGDLRTIMVVLADIREEVSQIRGLLEEENGEEDTSADS